MALAFGEFVFDPVRRELRKQGELLKVDPKQLDLLACFLSHPGRLLSKQELLDAVWEGRVVADSVLSVSVAKLRKVLGDVPAEHGYIENRYGRGYRFLAAITQVAAPQSGGPETRSSAPPLPAAPISGSLLVGRSETMQRLNAAWTRARGGEGGIVALIGEPGIGKTRLAEALEQTVRGSGALTAWGRFQPAEGAPPLWPFVQVMRELDASGLADEIVRLLRDRPAQASASADGPSNWGLSRGLMQESVNTSHRTIDQIAQALVKLARERPLLILLDDLQWADAASLRLLAYVSGDIARWPMLIVTTQRSTETYSGEDRRSGELLRLLTHRNCERIELQRLGEEDVAEYVSAQFGPNVGGETLCRTVYKRSEGNPFFMVELLRPWLGGAQPEPEQLALSDFALDPVRQRLLRLPESARSVLSGAAVIGHDFDLGLLGYVTQRGADELLEALDGSLANDTIVPSSEVVGGYAFDHELIREVLYADLAASERCRLHLRAGEALLRRRAAGNQVASGELAHHFLAALPQGDVNVAIEHAREAAMASNRLAARSDARKLLQRALEALKFGVAPPVETRTVLLLELAVVERALGEPKYLAHLEQAVQLAREHKLGPLLTAAGRMLSLAPGLLVQGDALSVLEAARDVLPPEDAKRRAIVLAHLAWTPPNCRSARAVEALLREAEALAETSNDLTARAAVRDAKLFFSGGPATQAAADALVGEIEREIQSHPELFSGRKLTVLTHRYITAMQRGNLAAMERAAAARASELAKLNNLELNWHQERMLAVHSLNCGEFSGAPERLTELRTRAKQLNLQAWPTLWALDYGTLLQWTTGMGEFAERLRPTFAWQSSDSPQARAHKLRGMVDCGFLDDARAALAQISVESLHDFPTDRDYLAFLAHYAVASIATGSLAHCSALYEELSPFPQHFAVGISYHCYSSISHLLGGLALALGREAKALEHFEEAVKRNGEMGWKPWLVRSQLDLARLLLTSSKLRDSGRAAELLEEALQLAAACGMKPLLEEIQRERQAFAAATTHV